MRSARPIPISRLVPALLATVALLAGCGDRFTPPAATVDGVEISQATLERRLDAVLADPGLASRLTGPTGEERRRDLVRELLGFLIRQRVVAAYAERNGITVSEAEIDQTLDQTIAQLGGRERFDEELRRRGISLEDVRENVRESLLTNKVREAVARERLGTEGPLPAQADQVYSEWLEQRVRAADIEVNPRFGAFDPDQGTVCRLASTAGHVSCHAPF